MLGGRYAWQNDAAGTRLSAAHLQIVDGGTHWMVVSAAVKHLKVSKTHAGPSSIIRAPTSPIHAVAGKEQ